MLKKKDTFGVGREYWNLSEISNSYQSEDMERCYVERQSSAEEARKHVVATYMYIYPPVL